MIVGDAIRYLEDSKRQGRHFDFIFGDLTDVPINTDHNCKETGMMILKPVSTVAIGNKILDVSLSRS